MSHRKRCDAPNRVFHITSRVNWRAWHLATDAARRELVRLIAEAAEAFSVRVLAWVIMANHLHLVAQSPPPALFRQLTGRRTKSRHFRPWPRHHQNASVISQFMRHLRRGTSVRRQRALGLSGRFWEGAYDARAVDSPRSLVIRVAYDHLNPVVQDIVPTPELYEWSSAREWAAGQPSHLPVALTPPLPFDLDPEDLRRRVAELQQRQEFVDGHDRLGPLLHLDEDPTQEAWQELLDELRDARGTNAATD